MRGARAATTRRRDAPRDDGLDPQLRERLLPPALAERRRGALAPEERARPRRVPGAALVVADAASTGLEHRRPGFVERLEGHEPDELHIGHAAIHTAPRGHTGANTRRGNRMKRSILGAAFVAALVLVTVAGAAPTVVASPGPARSLRPGAQPCGNNDIAAEQIAQNSTLYPDSEIEPRSTRFGSTIVGEYQQDRWNDGGARGLVTSVSHDNGLSWHRVVVRASPRARAASTSGRRIRGCRSRRTATSTRSR